jgi:hypothetical protein
VRHALPLFLLLSCTSGPDPKDVQSACASTSIAQPWDPAEQGALTGKIGAREGDFLLANDQLQLVIQGPGRHIAVNPYGGNLIDADLRRPDGSLRDALGELGLFLNLAGTLAADHVELIPADPAAGRCGATVIASGGYALSDFINPKTGIALLFPGLSAVDLDAPYPLAVELHYTLQPEASHVDLEVHLINQGEEPVPALVTWLLDAGLVDPFLPKARGFEVDTIAAGEFLALEGREQAFALVPLTETRLDLRGIIGLVGAYGVGHDAVLTDLLGFPDTAPSLEPGQRSVSRAAFVVGGDLAEVLPIVHELLGDPACVPITGEVRELGSELPLAGVEVTASALDPAVDLSNTTTDEAGRFTMCLPPGEVTLIAGQEGRPYAGGGPAPAELSWTVSETPITLHLPPTATLRATATDAAGAALPARLTVVGLDPSPPDPRLGGDSFDPLPPGITAIRDSVDGTFELPLEPGTYEVWLSRGPEYDASATTITLSPNDVAEVSATLHRVLDTTGFMSGDFHVHAQASTDSTVRDEARVANMLAEGVEILVSTDHAYITDYQPIIEALGRSDLLTSIPGEEITTFDYGHYCGFPLPVDVTSPNQGAIDWTGQSPDEILALAGVPGGRTVVQLNHPRAIPAPGTLADYFTTLDLQFDATGPFVGSEAIDPLTVRLEANDRLLSTNFVAIEVMTWVNVQGLSDWFNFLNAGIRFTATGNSDTHTTRVESSGWPRNLVLLGQDEPEALEPDDLVEALTEGRNAVSFGPFADLIVVGATTGRLGDTVRPREDGTLTLQATVQAATWSPFDRVEVIEGASGVIVGGGAVVPVEVEAGGGRRLEARVEVEVSPAADAWYVVLVTGSAGLFPVVALNQADPTTLTWEAVVARKLPGQATAFALTNPIFVDADRDGEITPSHRVQAEDHETWRREDRTDPY